MNILAPRSSRHPQRAARWWWLLLLGALVCGGRPAGAQITIDVVLSRRTYILYEPIVATVTVTNLAGRDVTFEDARGKQWFNLEVSTMEGQIIQPYDPNYRLHSLTVPAGQSVKRKIDLNPLFPVRESGSHRLRANVYLADADKFFGSGYATFDITDGQLIWRQDVGVPGTIEVRQVSLMTFQRPDKLMLYVRIRDQDGNAVYTTQALGRLITTGLQPQAIFDRQNTLHILQEALPSAYLYTEISIDGERLTQKAYSKVGANRPTLRKGPDGEVAVHGGQLQEPAAPGPAVPVREPKLSDRPVALPAAKKPDGQ